MEGYVVVVCWRGIVTKALICNSREQAEVVAVQDKNLHLLCSASNEFDA